MYKYINLLDFDNEIPDINITCLFHICKITKTYLNKMAKIDRKKLEDDNNFYTDLEFETKICLNNMFLIIINNIDKPDFKNEITQPMYSIEYNSFLMIKLSLDLSIVPIKK